MLLQQPVKFALRHEILSADVQAAFGRAAVFGQIIRQALPHGIAGNVQRDGLRRVLPGGTPFRPHAARITEGEQVQAAFSFATARHIGQRIGFAQQAAAFGHKAHLPEIFWIAVRLQAAHGVGADRPVFRAQIFPVQPHGAGLADGGQHGVGQIAGKGFDNDVRRGNVPHIRLHARLPRAQFNAVMPRRQLFGRVGHNGAQRCQIVQPQAHLPTQPLLQLARQPPRHADIAEIVDNGTKQPAHGNGSRIFHKIERKQMIALIQRVRQASVVVQGETVGQIGGGLLVLLGVERDDTPEKADKLLRKVLAYRVFADEAGKMNLSLQQVCASDGTAGLLVVSQFTLAADTQKGLRPNFSPAAAPETARELYDDFCRKAAQSVPTECGRFGAEMQVSLVNDGPVTFWLQV